jgi:hypothetical protein
VSGEFERSVVLVAKERSGLAAPVAADDVRVSETGVGAEETRGDSFLVADQIVAPQDFHRGRANGLPAFLLVSQIHVSNVHEGSPRGSVTMKDDPKPSPGLSTLQWRDRCPVPAYERGPVGLLVKLEDVRREVGGDADACIRDRQNERRSRPGPAARFHR